MRIKKKRVQSPKIVELPSDTDEAIDLPVVSNESAWRAAKKIRQKNEDTRREKALKLLRLRGLEAVSMGEPKDPVSKKCAHISAKKISDKHKKMRNKKKTDLVENVQEAASKKSAQIVAEKISKKYQRMRNRKQPLPFSLNNLADQDSVVYDDERNLNDVRSNNNAKIVANKISKKKKKNES